MATGELILVMRPDLRLDGPLPVEYGRYYGSMLAREGFAVGHLGLNWLGTYDWSLSQSPTSGVVSVVTNRGQRIQFQPMPGGGFTLIQPTDQQYRLESLGEAWQFTDPELRRVYYFEAGTDLLSQIADEHGNGLLLSYSGGLLAQVSDGLGRAITFSYDPIGRVIQAGDGTRTASYGYSGDVLSTVTDAAGHLWTHTYVGPGPIQGLLTGITEPLGNTPLTQEYDASGRVLTQTDAAGGISNYAYTTPTGNVFSDPLGNPWTYQHDAQDRLVTLIDPAGGPTSYAYDTLGRPWTISRPMGDMTSFSYDPASGYPSTLTLADGSPIGWVYSSHAVGAATMFDLAKANYPDATSETYGRDAAGNVTGFKDRGGFLWQGTYNLRGQPLTFTNPSLGVRTFTYDTPGRLATAQDHAGNTTQLGYDGLSRLTQVTWPDATGRQYAYDNLDHRTTLTDERGKVWSQSYDANGRLASATDPLLEVTTWVYDLLDRVTQVVDPLSHAHTYAYDAAGRVSSATDRSGRTTTYQYDTVGRLTGVVDPAGGTDTYAYDANSRMTSRQDPLAHVTLVGHDALDRVTSVTDPVGSMVTYAYDGMGRLISATAPLGHTETFSYDPRGLLTSFVNVSSVTGWPRTPLGEVAQVTDPNLNAWSRGYDPQGRLMSAADPLARTTGYGYDALSRPTQITRPDGSTEQLAYDAAGRVTGASYSGGPALAYGYDDANRLTSATGASFVYDAAGRMTGSNGIAMTYDGAGRLLSATLAPGKVVTYGYDSRGLLSQVTDWLGGTTSFTYDTARRLTGMTRPNGTGATYAYDAADRLISAVETQPGPINTPLSSISITRDALGLPTSIDRRQPLMPGETTPATTAFSYDAASQLNGVGHDPLGRTTSEGARTFQWDGASRLTRYAAGADSPQFSYDAFGRVLTRTQGAQTGQYVWNYVTGVPSVGTINSAPQGPRHSVHTPSGLLLHRVDGSTGARLFYHYDESGNTIFLTNDAGSVVTEYAYKPFGGVSGLGQTADNPFTYGAASGVIALGSSGLWAVGPRVYDDRTIRVISGGSAYSGLDMVAARPPPNGSQFGMDLPLGFVPKPLADRGDHLVVVGKGHDSGISADGVMVGGVHSIEGIESETDIVEYKDGEDATMHTRPGNLKPGKLIITDPGPINSPSSWVTAGPGYSGPTVPKLPSVGWGTVKFSLIRNWFFFDPSNQPSLHTPWFPGSPDPVPHQDWSYPRFFEEEHSDKTGTVLKKLPKPPGLGDPLRPWDPVLIIYIWQFSDTPIWTRPFDTRSLIDYVTPIMAPCVPCQ